MPLASIPSPGHPVWHLGPLPVRAYALCVIAGLVVALVVASRRYRRSGGQETAGPGLVLDVAAWAIPFGLIGALAHVILLDHRHAFGDEYRLWHAVTAGIGAIGVPGAVALGALGAWIACRRARAELGPVAGAVAPALAFGLAAGGLGNWWAQQFYGPPSTWWWAVRISPTHRVPGYENYATFQPVFLYLSLWEVALGIAVIWAARRFALSGGRTFMLCAAGYAAGDFWAQVLRAGPLPHALGMRYGALGDVAVFVLAVLGMYLTRSGRRPPARAPAKRAVVEDSSGDVMSV
jgi:prolipoprotein diacylglyceryltransferase